VDVLNTKGNKFLLHYLTEEGEVFKVVETIGDKKLVKSNDEIIDLIDLSVQNNTVKLLYIN
jgi:hypothetical protein